ncbi:hypothetical protein [Roseburia sp. 1XD42-69]|jgi:hypothetical protein|uniref:hypothetical protein n=1 Tax=Roseburia sp. 1XD42-69 TaxID=2320088 RepID=UPI000EA3F0A5|nr:hypothetical protein [Roseburia sp. 1XD42-69]RKJ61478.1 hypothetical protein D7Y06_20230 [Roseburia sp. 1XD42-69]
MDILLDGKLKCISILTRMTVSDYLGLVEKAYSNRGGISGQREALKQKTAISIRNRMIEDIKGGTILPPIVVGAVVSGDRYDEIVKGNATDEDLKNEIIIDQLSIIDGMQRTTALLKAVSEKEDVNKREIRVEYWISDNSNSLLYRMLVLNTGQVPWNVRRQIEVIFSGIIKEIRDKVNNIEVITISDSSRRSKGGQYQAGDLVELFLAFGARTWKINTKEKLTDEFTRHDFLQSSGEIDLVNLFCEVLENMVNLDILIDTKCKKSEEENTSKFKTGKDLFASQPARIGFISAAGEKIIGRPGDERSQEKIDECKRVFFDTINNVSENLKAKSDEDVLDYIDFATLNQKMERKMSKVGDYERELFYEAFKVLIDENGEVNTLGICWRAI